MTIDDDNSIYVGGLPYECTEDSLRKIFDLYGHIVAIKIINDRDIGGKCYGFVTFTNPRCAVDAINDMNGRTVGGRVVRVNEVKTRGGRPSHENFRRDTRRDFDMVRGRGRERDHHRDRYQHRDRNIGRSRDRDRDYEHVHSDDHVKDHFLEREREDHNYNSDKDRDIDGDQDKELNRSVDRDRNRDKDKKLETRNQNGSHATESRSREYSPSSSGENHGKVKEELEIFIQRRDELQNEVAEIEQKLNEKSQFVSDLQERAQKLENSLAAAKKVSSQRKSHLAKVQRCYMQVRDYSERLKNSEEELQVLVDTAMLEADESDVALA